ncbi:restriction endonuclease subunit S [Bacillus sp. WMMC1349]|uniref:restriction endonuclease subunit S n=1 Tax=Bacillus sp. WMMC1349 TaxID=2736254 RepID=UPI0015527B75|nr:restriction endonuclease subunit S [Bacillus sp. WMMC1349]NPC94085.1 restriction endonuclease subunit S [Bacillus sp. WMMC1349]
MVAPKLRFNGFKEDWKTVKFKSLFSEVNEKTGDTKSFPLYSLTVQDGVTKKTDRYNREFLVKKDDNYKIVRPDYFVSNPMNMTIGALAQYKGSEDISVSGYYNVFKNISNYKNQFLEDYLKSSKMIWLYKSIATGSLIEKQRVHFSQFIELAVRLPDYEEANKISDFMEILTKKIKLQQEKIDLLKEQKKGYMQKIFRKELRFKDKNGRDFPNWKVYKLSDFSSRITRKNSNLETKRPLTISAQYGLIDQIEFFNKNVASGNLEGYYLLQKGEFAYNKSYSNGFPLGTIKRLDNYEDGALSTLYICFAPKDNMNSDFLVHYFDSTQWHKAVALICVEGARNHGLLNVSVSDFFDTEHELPCKEEQIAVAHFFNRINKKINLNEERLEKLQGLKQALMQQMFI